METIPQEKFILLQYLENFFLNIGITPFWADTLNFIIACALLALLIWIFKLISNSIIIRMIKAAVAKTKTLMDDFLYDRKFFNRLIMLVIACILVGTVRSIFKGYDPRLMKLLEIGLQLYITMISAFMIAAFLNALNDLYDTKPMAKRRSIKGTVQAIKIVVYILAGILCIAIMLQKNPTQLLVAFGASAAILTLVFKDTILGFVASIQISAQDMIRPGDWIEMPSKGADGMVQDINVSNVKVQNWDKTVTLIPIYSIVSEAFTNWRTMEEGNGRRFKRPLFIDVTSLKTLETPDIERIKTHPHTAANAARMMEISEATNTSDFVTNLGLYRCYAEAYLRNHPGVAQELMLIVRYLSPTENGLPMELYGFTKEKRFVLHEPAVADIFNHVLVVAPLFGIRLYQRPAAVLPTDIRCSDIPSGETKN